MHGFGVAADARNSKKMFQEIIFPRFGVPRVVISDGGSHLVDKTFRKCLNELGVNHWVATPYHPQTSGQDHGTSIEDNADYPQFLFSV
jgi:transposase InsO family protein